MLGHYGTTWDVGPVQPSNRARRHLPVINDLTPWLWASLVGGAVLVGLWGAAFRGWIPLDAGTLGLAASNVLDGQWPHVDFADPYPGLQAFIHAGVFQVFGESIATLRFAFLAVAVVAGVSSYAILRRFMSDWVAAVGSVSVVILGFVRYPTSIPSWWNVALGLATLAVVFTARQRGNLSLIAVGGLIGGINVLIKPTGAYFAIPILLWLLARSRLANRFVMTVVLSISLLLVTLVLAPVWSLAKLVLLWIPITVVLAVIALPTIKGLPVGAQVDPAITPVLFALGTALPAAAVASGYALEGEFDAIVEGWLLSPARRYEYLSNDIPFNLSGFVLAAGLICLFWLIKRRGLNGRLGLLPFVGLSFAAVFSWGQIGALVLMAMIWLPIAIVLLVLANQPTKPASEPLLVASVAVTFALVQIPDFSQFYVAYSTPALLIAAIVLSGPLSRQVIAGVFVIAVAFVWLGYQDRVFGGHTYSEPLATVPLDLTTGGIDVWVQHGYYSELADHVARESRGSSIYAGPDSPEVAFLANVDAASPAFFPALYSEWNENEIIAMSDRVEVVVINRDPFVSEGISDGVTRQLHQKYPHNDSTGNFDIWWRR